MRKDTGLERWHSSEDKGTHAAIDEDISQDTEQCAMQSVFTSPPPRKTLVIARYF